TDSTPGELIDAWADPSKGVWSFLGFSMQMCLILVTGHAVAASRPVAALLHQLASLPRSSWQGVMLVAFVAGALGLLNWGLGLIAGAILARDVGASMRARGLAVHFPLLAAAGYVGLLVWHGGLSGTAPLKVTTPAEIADTFGADAGFEPLPLTSTLFSPMNLIASGGLLLVAPLVLAMLVPPRELCEPPPPPIAVAADEEPASAKPLLPRLLEDTPIINWLLALLLVAWAWRFYFPSDGAPSGVRTLTPNAVNLTMLLAGLLLHGSPRSYLDAASESARGCTGILLQFPLYAGIRGVMEGSGLTDIMVRWLTIGATADSLPFRSFLSAALVNLFIPSGGGQWGVQGPVLMQAGSALDVPPERLVLSFAYGDQLTNMLQPFWALPLLAITRCKARDIVGYTALLMLVAGGWLSLCLWLL
ncbi:MAG: TIGR00366 family protein, partial [Planctomycetota bacterium]